MKTTVCAVSKSIVEECKYNILLSFETDRVLFAI